MIKKSILLMSILTILIVTGCVSENRDSESENKEVIVTSFFPTQEIAKSIVNDTSEVKLMIPKGVDPHSYEPTPRQLQELSNADIFITMGGDILSSIENDLIDANPDLKIIDATKDLDNNIEGSHNHDIHKEEHNEIHEENHSESDMHESHEEEHHEEDNHENHEDEHSNIDPHIWLSIDNMKTMTHNIEEGLIEQYPVYSEVFENNSNKYSKKLNELKSEYEEELNNCKHDTIIVNHKAFGYLAKDYNFEQKSVAGFSPRSEPTPSAIKEIIDTAKNNNLTYIFSEGQFDDSISNTIAQDLDGEVLEINPILQERHENYFDMMRENLNQLKIGMDCE